MAKNWFYQLMHGKKNVGNIIEDNTNYDSQKVGSISIPDTITDENAFILANTVAEINFPIDFYADRLSKLRYYIADKTGKELITSELNRFITSINPLYSFSEIVYQYVFSYLADGNALTYLQVPSMYKEKDNYKGANVNNISRVDILQPNLVTIDEYFNVSELDVSKLTDLIRRIRYDRTFGGYKELAIDGIRIDTIDITKKDDSVVLAKSPLFKCYRSINNLLATYSARYNVYVNNGAAGYIVKKNQSKTAIESAVDPGKREDILADINNRQGLTGHRNLWGVSGVPIEFINTLISIKDLLPFEETLEDSIKIAGVFQIPTGLIPRKDQSTYDNQGFYERAVWENGLFSMAQVVCDNFTKNLGLDKVGAKYMVDYSSVSCLKANDGEVEDLMTKKIANNATLYEKGIITYNEFLSSIGKESIIGGDKLIFDMNKTPYAVKLGVGGTQAMQLILTDANMTDDMKKNSLIVIFGLTEEEAKKIISK